MISFEYASLLAKHVNENQIDRFQSPDAEKLFMHRIGWPDHFNSENRAVFTSLEEVSHFEAMHYVKWQLRECLRMQHCYRAVVKRYNQVRSRVVNANLGLVYATVEMFRKSNDDDSMISDGLLCLMRSSDCFDPWRGNRFTTYAVWSIRRMLTHNRKNKILFAQEDLLFGNSLDYDLEQKQAVAETYYLERLLNLLKTKPSLLSDVETLVLHRRFAIGCPRQKLREVGAEIGVCSERVRQIQDAALEKLRERLMAEPV